MEYLRGDRDRPLVLGTDNDGLLMWYVYASFAVHRASKHARAYMWWIDTG
jgi:hypothetical protein